MYDVALRDALLERLPNLDFVFLRLGEYPNASELNSPGIVLLYEIRQSLTEVITFQSRYPAKLVLYLDDSIKHQLDWRIAKPVEISALEKRLQETRDWQSRMPKTSNIEVGSKVHSVLQPKWATGNVVQIVSDEYAEISFEFCRQEVLCHRKFLMPA